MTPYTVQEQCAPQATKKIVVIGMGYVGFPLACAIARNGNYETYGFDIDAEKINKINNRVSPIEDKQAEEDIKEVTICATTDGSILRHADYIVICVPTPIDEHRRPDLTPVKESAKLIARSLQKGQMIILESTVNPGICEEVVLPILEESGLKGGVDFELAHCPERINPGDREWNVYNIPRNVGALTREGTKKAAEFYRSFINAPVNEVSSIKVAEATKIVENTFRDVNIAYVNELAQFFDRMGIDIMEVIGGASNKPFAFMPHFPGCGVGGHCIPVDPYYLIEKADDLDFDHRLVRTAREVNNHMPKYTVKKLVNGLKEKGFDITNTPIGILGLAYKANSSDMRESPAFEIKKELLRLGATVVCYDPYCSDGVPETLEFILKNCPGVIIATNHAPFLSITDWKNVKVLIDGKNCLDKNKIPGHIYYRGIGRGA